MSQATTHGVAKMICFARTACRILLSRYVPSRSVERNRNAVWWMRVREIDKESKKRRITRKREKRNFITLRLSKKNEG